MAGTARAAFERFSGLSKSILRRNTLCISRRMDDDRPEKIQKMPQACLDRGCQVNNLQGGVRFPTGGKGAEMRMSPRAVFT